MAYGVTDEGFKLKRLEQILLELRQDAAAIFQDLLEPGDIVDTSDSSTLGRWINLISIPEAEQWENGQLVYSSFDPNTAVGIALDNLIELSGIPKRKAATYSNTTGVISGVVNSTVPINSVVGSVSYSYNFKTTRDVVLTTDDSVGIAVSIANVLDNTAYEITYTSTTGLSSNTVTYTSDSDTTEDEILLGLLSVIVSSHPTLSGSIQGSTLFINKASIFQASNFFVSTNLTIEESSKVVSLIAETTGELPAPSGSLTVIKTPAVGWNRVTNPLTATLGSDIETDEELRLRFYNTKFERSTNTLDAIYSALVNVEGVESVSVYENDTDFTDILGITPHSFAAVVLGGDAEDIANAIYQNKPAGVRSVGDQVITIYDIQGFPRQVRFIRPSPVNIFVTIDLLTYPDFPSDGAAAIRSAIISFALSEFGVGGDVIYSRLYTPINSVQGHSVTSMFIGTSPSPSGTSNIPINFDEISNFTSANIIINETVAP